MWRQMRFHEFPQPSFLFVLFKSNVLGDRQKIFVKKKSFQFLKYARAILRKGRYAPGIDHNGVAFSIELSEWGRTLSDFGGKADEFFIFTVSKRTRMFVLQVKSKVFFIQYKVDT